MAYTMAVGKKNPLHIKSLTRRQGQEKFRRRCISMKKIITLMMVLVMVVALAVPALAAENGVTPTELKLYKEFAAIVDKWATDHPDYSAQAGQYKNTAWTVLLYADLDADACADLRKAMYDVDAYIAKNAPTSEDGIADFVNAVEKMANDAGAKHNISVQVSDSGNVNVIIVDGDPVAIVPAPVNPKATIDEPTDNTKPGDNTKPSNPVIKQTGFDMTNTIIVAAVLAIALLGSAVIISKKRLASNH
jgi:hypothetical protein